MVKLQHRIRRDGGITVESTHYRLDGEGCIEVSEAHAEILARADAGNWGAPASWPEVVPVALPEALPGVGRRPRTRAELEEAARAEGFLPPETPRVSPPSPEPPPAPEPPTAAAPTAELFPVLAEPKPESHPEPTPVVAAEPETAEPETIEVSKTMSLEQLRAVAHQLGIKVPKRATQAEVFELIKAQGEEQA